MGISETKREGEGLVELQSGHQIYEVGKTEENKTRKGIAILVNKRLKDYIEEFKTHTDRIVSWKIKLKGKQTLQIIQVYAPTSSYEDEEVEMFYEEIEKATYRKQCKHRIIMGDFNAKIGKKGKGEFFQCTGPFGTGERNERVEMLINFTESNKFTIANSLFEKPGKRMWTWESPDGQTRNQIDFIMVSDRTIVKNCEVITKVDIGSDHRMLRGTIKINRKLERLKRIKRLRPFKVNIKWLEQQKDVFQLSLSNRFKALQDEPASIETLHTTVQKEVTKIKGNRDTRELIKTPKDLEIEALDIKRKALKKKEAKTTAEKVEYTELNKTVKKKRRIRAKK